MDWNGSVFTLISLRSFSSIWFWMVLAVSWSVVSHSPLGVPFDMVLRARRQGGSDMEDLQALVKIQLRRRAAILGSTGVILTMVAAALLTTVAVLGFAYRMEFAQALSLLLIPLTLVGLLRLRLMQRLLRDQPVGEALCKALTWHRTGMQALGMVAILITALYGMWFNLAVRTLGG